MNTSLSTLTLSLRILTAVEAVGLAVAAICVFDRQWAYAAFVFGALVAVYVVVDRSIQRRMARIRLEAAADQCMHDLLAGQNS